MSVYYVKEQGSYIKKVDQRLIIEKNGQRLADIPLCTITNLAVFGSVQVTTQALSLMMTEGIDVSFFSYSGKYLGQISAESSKNIFLRFSQYECYQDMNQRLELAKEIVRNKVENQISVIRNYNWDGIEYDFRENIKEMQNIVNNLSNQNTTNGIMGIEGSCSAVYFCTFSHMFKCELQFVKRSRRPPKDPINIILSLAYTLLTKEVVSALEAESFETYLGFLHGIRYGRKSLALDIVEEFRQPVVDRLVLLLFNKQMISGFDFEQQADQIVLTEGGFRKFCLEYEKWMKRPSCEVDNRCFRSIIRAQVSLLKHSIREKTAYVPYRWNPVRRKEENDVSDNV